MDEAPDDTICAIATPVGEGGIGIVRISGPGALSVAKKIVRLRSGRAVTSAASHTLHLADFFSCEHIFDPLDVTQPPSHAMRQRLDEGLFVYMAAPHSFTAEDVVELHCHGSALLLGRVCEACVAAGARLAHPGEFTKRAFLNGRLDLSQAEAVLDTIRAKSEEGLKVAQRHLQGDLGREVNRLRATLLDLLAHIEAGIDFSEEDIAFIGRAELLQRLEKTSASIRAMLATARSGRVLREGARVVIVGRPNVGKSSLLNRLLQEERAIVTDIPGTTRDVIEETAVLDGLAVTLVDTAGMRDTDDRVEREGIRRARAAEQNADVVLCVLDAGELAGGGEPELAGSNALPRLVLVNKIDLIDEGSAARLLSSLRERTRNPVISLSVRTGMGMAEIKQGIRALLVQGSLESREGVIVTNVRHQRALEQTVVSLDRAFGAIERQVAPECVAVDLREAADALGEITGVITSTEVLHRIFAEFCIGK